MATSENPLGLNGPLDDRSSIYRTKWGISIVSKKGGPSKKQIKTHPNFEATRKNISIFGVASKHSKTFRTNLKNVLEPLKDGRLNSRLNSTFQQLIRKHANKEAYPFLKADLLEFFPTIILNNSSPENLHKVKVTKEDNDNVWMCVCAELKQIKKYLLSFKKSECPSHFVLLSTLLSDTGSALSHENSSYIPIRQNSNAVCSIQHQIETRSKLLIHGFRIVFYQETSIGNFSLIQNEAIHPGWITKV